MTYVKLYKGDWSGYVDYKSVPMVSSKNKETKSLDVKTVTHNSQKRKLVLLEDGNVYKIKKTKLEDHVHPGLILLLIDCKMILLHVHMIFTIKYRS